MVRYPLTHSIIDETGHWMMCKQAGRALDIIIILEERLDIKQEAEVPQTQNICSHFENIAVTSPQKRSGLCTAG